MFGVGQVLLLAFYFAPFSWSKALSACALNCSGAADRATAARRNTPDPALLHLALSAAAPVVPPLTPKGLDRAARAAPHLSLLGEEEELLLPKAQHYFSSPLLVTSW